MSDSISTLLDRGKIHEYKAEIDKLNETDEIYFLSMLKYYNRLAEYPQTIEFYESELYKYTEMTETNRDLSRYEFLKARIQTGLSIDIDKEENYAQKFIKDRNRNPDLIKEFYFVAFDYNYYKHDYKKALKYLNLVGDNSVEYEDQYWYLFILYQTKLFLVTGRLTEAHKNLTLVENYISDNFYYQMLYHNLKGEYLSRIKELLEAKLEYHKVLTLYEIVQNKYQFAFALKNLSIISRIQGNFHEALDNLRLSKQIAIEIKNQPLEMSLRLAHGLNLLSQGDLYSAIEEFDYAARYYRQRNDLKNLIASMNNLAVCFVSLGEYEKALFVYNELIHLDQNTNPKDKVIINFNLASLSIRLNKLDNVEKIIERIENLLEDNSQLLNYRCYKIYLKGILAIRMGNYKLATKNLYAATKEFEFTNNLVYAIESKYNLSRVNYLVGNYSKAIQYLTTILEYQIESENVIGQIHSLFLKFRIYLELGDQSKLEETYHQIEEISTDYPSVALRQQAANLVLQQKISGIDLSAEILGVYDRIENGSTLDIEFYLFILSHQASYLLDLYMENNDCELLNKFSNIVSEIYDLYSTSKSPDLALSALILQYQYSRIMGDHDGQDQYQHEANTLAKKYGLECKLVI